MIYPAADGTFTISSRGAWLPGIYDSERSARYAFRFGDLELSRLSGRICHKAGERRAISMDDLRELRKAKT
jgi:hypothetical protein